MLVPKKNVHIKNLMMLLDDVLLLICVAFFIKVTKHLEKTTEKCQKDKQEKRHCNNYN